MAIVEKDKNSRAKEDDQNRSFVFINFRVITQSYSLFHCLVVVSSRPGNDQKTCIWWAKTLLIKTKRKQDKNKWENKERKKDRTEIKELEIRQPSW